MLFDGFAPWRDPTITEINRLAMRTALVMSDTLDDTRARRATRRTRLDGAWRFRLFDQPEAVRESDLRGKSSLLGRTWRTLAVPGNWTMQDVGDHPHYTNIDMPFDGPPPNLPEHNPTGVYRRSFNVPVSWRSQQVVLHIGAADSVHLVYVNRRFVGYGTDNRLASEYDVSQHVRPGNNELAIVVVRYSAHSYVEDQDQWWMAGLHRSVFVEARPTVHVRNIECTTDFDSASGLGTATVEVEVGFVHEPQPGVSVQMWFEELSGKRVTQPVMCEVPHDHLKRYVFAGHRATATFTLPKARAWSAEDPYRYRLVVKLLGPSRGYTSLVTGFRRIRVEDGEVRINDSRITIRGVNRHDHHPLRGKAVTRQDMIDDIVAMKRHNCNAVRTSHYPNDSAFLDLCDEYGLYVVAEANIESHAYNTSLCNDPQYLAAWMSRGSRMVVRDRHHPSVIFWSLGNESGFGTNHDALAALVRTMDPSRPLHYEGAIFHVRNGDTNPWANGGMSATDVVCPMYPPISSIVAYARSGASRPLIMCEYSHAMGNSNGSLADYWAAIESEPLLAGGFVWEWKDHGLHQQVDPRTNVTKAKWRYAYGGQFGDQPNDGNFVADGINAADLAPHPAMRELAWVHRPVAVSPSGDRAFSVHNRRSHTSLADLHGTTTLLVGGEVQHESEVVVDLAPHARAVVPIADEVLAIVSETAPGATVTLQFRFVTRTESPYAPAGHLVSWDEITLHAPVDKAPPVVGTPQSDSGDAAAADAVLATPVRLALMRAPIDNDGYKLMPGFGEQHRIGGRALARWQRVGVLDDEIPAGVLHVQQREVRADGSVVYRHRVTVPDQHASLPRIGVKFELPAEFGYVRWFGRGPHENYPDRNASALRDVWAREPDESPYLVPQEFGLRTDCEWVEFVSTESVVRIDVLSPATMHFSAVHHTPSQLYAATDSTQLERNSNLVVHLDVAHRGVGTASCGPDVLPQYEIPAGTFEFSYVVRRI